jgi:hypothetical protein
MSKQLHENAISAERIGDLHFVIGSYDKRDRSIEVLDRQDSQTMMVHNQFQGATTRRQTSTVVFVYVEENLVTGKVFLPVCSFCTEPAISHHKEIDDFCYCVYCDQ